MVIRGNRIACADKECGFVKNREDKD